MTNNYKLSGHETHLCFYGIKDSATIQLDFKCFSLLFVLIAD